MNNPANSMGELLNRTVTESIRLDIISDATDRTFETYGAD
jgi:hypothetical protein